MTAKKRIEIVDDFKSGDVQCRSCGKTIHLYFNRGELDEKECCGIVYQTRATGYELVITRRNEEV